MTTLLDILSAADFKLVLIILGSIALVLAFCAILIWNDLFRNKKK